MPTRDDAVDSSTVDVLNVALERMTAEVLNPAAQDSPDLRRELTRELSRCGGLIQGGAETDQGWAAPVAGLSSLVVGVEVPTTDGAMKAAFALLYEAGKGRAPHALGEHHKEVLAQVESWVDEGVFLEVADKYVDEPGDAVSLELERRRDAHRLEAGRLAAVLGAAAATFRAGGKPELAALLEAAARRLAQVAKYSALVLDRVQATSVSRPDPAPPPQVLSGHSIWTHGPPNDAPASSRERVASGARRGPL